VYNLSYTLKALAMGKGLSKYQRAVLEALERRGALTIFDVDDVVWEVKHRGGEEYKLIKALRSGLKCEVKDIRNYAGLYRLMRSLVKRRLAGRVLHVRPVVWIKLEDGKPSMEALEKRTKLFTLISQNKLTVEIGGEAKVYGLTKP